VVPGGASTLSTCLQQQKKQQQNQLLQTQGLETRITSLESLFKILIINDLLSRQICLTIIFDPKKKSKGVYVQKRNFDRNSF